MSQKEILRATVTWLGAMEYLGEDSQGRKIPMEATQRFGGTGKSPIPLEIMLASLGGCIGVDTRYFLLQRGLGFEALKVSMAGTRRDEVPRTFEKIDVLVQIKGAPDQAAVKEVVDQVMTRLCPIAVILGATSDMGWRIEHQG
jgi:putative redox protein